MAAHVWLPFEASHFPEERPPLRTPHDSRSAGAALVPSAHPYIAGVGGPRFSLMTEWDDLAMAVRCAWTVPADITSPSAEGPTAALLDRETTAAVRTSMLVPVSSPDDFFRALRHAFDHLRAAVLVSIRNGKLVLFMPFANDAAWRSGVTIHLPRGAGSVDQYIDDKYRGQNARRKETMIQDASRWWFNGHVVCNVRPDNVWGDAQLDDLFDIIVAALRSERVTVPDVDFLLNKRDCPLLVNPRAPLLTLPVLSPYTSSGCLDIPFPLADDWRLAHTPLPDMPDWNTRAARAVFRGSSTGSGITIETNLRLRLAMFASTPAASPWLDAKITRVNDRCQVLLDAAAPGTVCVDYPRAAEIRNRLREANAWSSYEAIESQARRFKFAIYIRGHQAASRLAALFRLHFCVVMLCPDGEEFDAPGCRPWFDDILVSYDGWKLNTPASTTPALTTTPPSTPAPTTTMAPSTPAPTTPAPTTTMAPSTPAPSTPAGPQATLAKEFGDLFSRIPARKRRRPADAASPFHYATNQPVTALHCDSRVQGEQETADVHRELSPPMPNHVVCRVRNFDELIRCVRFLAEHDSFANMIADNGRHLIGAAVINPAAIAGRAAEAMCKAASIGRTKEVSGSTHPLFGVMNHEYITKRSARLDS
jgi:hypothetical protein